MSLTIRKIMAFFCVSMVFVGLHNGWWWGATPWLLSLCCFVMPPSVIHTLRIWLSDVEARQFAYFPGFRLPWSRWASVRDARLAGIIHDVSETR